LDIVAKIAADWAESQASRDKVGDDQWGQQWGGEPFYRQVEFFTHPFVSGRVVELGCGGGKFTHMLAQRADHVTAIDVHEQAVNETKRRVPGAEVLLTSGDCIPLEDESVDMVACFDTLQHLPVPLVQHYMIEARRVARKYFLFTIPNIMTAAGKAYFHHSVLRRSWERLYELGYMNYYHPGHVHKMMDIAAWKSTLIANVGHPRPRDMLILGYRPGQLTQEEHELCQGDT